MDAARAATIGDMTEEDYRAIGWNGDPNTPGAKQFIERCQLGPVSRVLEIGCGIARIGRELAPHVGEWHGADISQNMLALARDRCKHLNNVRFIELRDSAALATLPAETYDFVYCTVVLMHLDKEDVFQYLRQAHRVTKQNGWAYFDTWNILHPDTFRIWVQSTVSGENKPRGRMQCSTPAELRTYLENAGFDIVRLEPGQRLIQAYCRKSSDSPALIVDDSYPPFGLIGVPKLGETLSGNVNVEGFVLDNVRRVRVFVDGELVDEAEPTLLYEEILPFYTRYGEQVRRCRFGVPFDTRKVANGEHELRVEATDVNGVTANVTGNYWGFRVKN